MSITTMLSNAKKNADKRQLLNNSKKKNKETNAVYIHNEAYLEKNTVTQNSICLMNAIEILELFIFKFSEKKNHKLKSANKNTKSFKIPKNNNTDLYNKNNMNYVKNDNNKHDKNDEDKDEYEYEDEDYNYYDYNNVIIDNSNDNISSSDEEDDDISNDNIDYNNVMQSIQDVIIILYQKKYLNHDLKRIEEQVNYIEKKGGEFKDYLISSLKVLLIYMNDLYLGINISDF